MHFIFRIPKVLLISELAVPTSEWRIEKLLPFSLKGKVQSKIWASKSKLQILLSLLKPNLSKIPQDELSKLLSLKIDPVMWVNWILLWIISKVSICKFYRSIFQQKYSIIWIILKFF